MSTGVLGVALSIDAYRKSQKAGEERLLSQAWCQKSVTGHFAYHPHIAQALVFSVTKVGELSVSNMAEFARALGLNHKDSEPQVGLKDGSLLSCPISKLLGSAHGPSDIIIPIKSSGIWSKVCCCGTDMARASQLVKDNAEFKIQMGLNGVLVYDECALEPWYSPGDKHKLPIKCHQSKSTAQSQCGLAVMSSELSNLLEGRGISVSRRPYVVSSTIDPFVKLTAPSADKTAETPQAPAVP